MKIFNRVIPATILALILIAGLGSAGLLTYYGMITGTATVEQSVKVDGYAWDSMENTYDAPGVAGNTVVDGPHSLTNDAEVPATVVFETEQQPEDTGTPGKVEGITTRYYGELELENKDGNWDIISGDDTSGLLKYYLDGSTFDYEFSATGLQANTDYSLIYYADQPDRFVNWGGDNPGALIDEFTTDIDGDITLTSGSKDLEMDLPSGADANINEYSYCPSDKGDNYKLCHGAKIWLVPTDALPVNWPNDGDIWDSGWNPSEYLFETNLISYHDADVDGGFKAYQGTMDFYIENDFDIALIPDIYTITTNIVPVA